MIEFWPIEYEQQCYLPLPGLAMDTSYIVLYILALYFGRFRERKRTYIPEYLSLGSPESTTSERDLSPSSLLGQYSRKQDEEAEIVT